MAALAVVIAAVAAVLSTFSVSSSGLKSRSPSITSLGAAQSQFYVDTRRSSLVSPAVQAPDLIARARLVASFVNSTDVKTAVARRLGLPVAAISVEGPLPDTPGQQSVQPVAQQRANSLLSADSPYSIYVDTDLTSSTVTLFVQADTGRNAVRMARAVPQALSEYLGGLARRARAAEERRLERDDFVGPSQQNREEAAARRRRQLDLVVGGATVVRGLGEPIGGDVKAETGSAIGGLVFVVVLLALWALIIVVGSLRSRRAGSTG